MSVLPFLANSLPPSGPQVYFIAHTWPHLADSCATSDNPPTLFSILNISLFTYHSNYLHGCNYYTLRQNYDWSLTLPNRSFLMHLFFMSVSGGDTYFYHILSVSIHDYFFSTSYLILSTVHIPLHLLITPFL